MMRPTKKMLVRIGAAGVIVAAFASAAMAADTAGALGSESSAASAQSAVSKVSLPATASAVASAVLDAITGGSSPSSVAAERANGQANKGSDETVISAAEGILRVGTAGTVGVRPGWGCGDKNHTHSGPPGQGTDLSRRPPNCPK